MQGPDYTQWHGFFEVAEDFCFKFLPGATHAAEGDPAVLAVIPKGSANESRRLRRDERSEALVDPTGKM